MTRQTTDKAHALYNRLTSRYNVPGSKVASISITAGPDAITLDALFVNGSHAKHDLDPTRGILDLNRQAQVLLNQHIDTVPA